MNLPKTVQLTNFHITQGEADSCSHCPLALALRPYIPKEYVPHIGEYAAQVYTKDYQSIVLSLNMEHELSQWVSDFDNGDKSMKPITIIINRKLKEIRMEECDS